MGLMLDSRQAIGVNQAEPRYVGKVLNAGSGPKSTHGLHPIFADPFFCCQETRIDIDPEVKPDIVGCITDMSSVVPSKAFDAIWSSHTLEHLHDHQVMLAIYEFRRVLKPNGFALVTSPDLDAIASLIVAHGVDHIAYTSPAGPITPLDMLFGHKVSIARGKLHMAHNTGFTCTSLGQKLVAAGFPVVYARRQALDIWALAMMEQADADHIRQHLLSTGLDMFDRTKP